jgi:hypothetical protein
MWLFWLGFSCLYAGLGGSPFVDETCLGYLLILTIGFSLFIRVAPPAVIPLFLMVGYYFFLRYMLSSLDAYLLFHFGQDTWMYNGLIWWLPLDGVKVALRHACLGLFSIGAGLLVGASMLSGRIAEGDVQGQKQHSVLHPGTAAFVVTFVFFFTHAIYKHINVAYGGLSGIEHTSADNWFNLISLGAFGNVVLCWFLFPGLRSSKRQKQVLAGILIVLVGVQVLAGSRSSLYHFLINGIVLVSIFYGDFRVRKRVLSAILAAVCLAVVLYPTGKMMKNIWKSWAQLSTEIVADSQFDTKSFYDARLSDPRVLGLEIIDRLADFRAPMTIINDLTVVSPGPHIGLLQSAKRALNDMVPGVIFHDVIRTSILYEYLYSGRLLTYGGEEWGVLGVFYIHFGYAGSLLALFSVFVVLGAGYRKLLRFRSAAKPVLAVYGVVVFFRFLHNGSFEYWLANVVYAGGLHLVVVCVVLMTVSFALRSMRQVGAGAARPVAMRLMD